MATLPIADVPWEIGRTELNGLPVYSAPSAGSLLHGCLTFRVGVTDEAMSQRGITHLIEHLVLKGLGEKAYRYNGMVDGLFARFFMSGRAGDLVEFFNHVSAALRALPMDRIVQESAVLRAESARRPVEWLSAMYAYRYGFRSWGLLAADELGLVEPRPERLEQWIATYFSTSNAALWLSGALPAGLRIELDEGRRMLPGEPEPVLTALPAWVTQKANGLGITITGQRSTELRLITHVLQRRAQSELRDSGLSYSVQLSYEPQTKNRAHIGLWADALPANMGKVGAVLMAVVDQLAEQGPRSEELEQYIGAVERTHEDPEALVGWLAATASDGLLDAPALDWGGWFDELRQVTPEAARLSLASALPSALLMVPPEVEPPAGRFTAVPRWSEGRVTGITTGLRLGLSTAGRNIRLTVGDDGVTLAHDERRIITVWFRQCAAMLTWKDGSRTLFGEDASRLHLCPRDWPNGASIIRWIDRHVAADRVVPMGDRPKPDPQALVHEPTYGFKTEYLTAVVCAIWGTILLGVLLAIANVPNWDPAPLVLPGILGIPLSVQLYYRLRAPRVRQS